MFSRSSPALILLLACSDGAPPSSSSPVDDTPESPVETDTGQGEGGESTDPVDPFYELGRGCTLEEEGDIGSDGVVDWTTSTTYNSMSLSWRLEIVSQRYVHVNGDTATQFGEYDSLGNALLYERVDQRGGFSRGTRSEHERDEAGNITAFRYSHLDGDVWEEDYSGTRTPIEGDFARGYDEVAVAGGATYLLRAEHSYTEGRLDQTAVWILEGSEWMSFYFMLYDYEDRGLLLRSSLVAGLAYGEEEAGRVLIAVDYTYNAAGVRVSEVVTEYDGETELETGRIHYDDVGRPLSMMEYSYYVDQTLSSVYTWDGDLDRRSRTVHADSADPAGDYTETHSYEGDWPWVETAVRVYDDASLDLDAVVRRAWSCP